MLAKQEHPKGPLLETIHQRLPRTGVLIDQTSNRVLTATTAVRTRAHEVAQGVRDGLMLGVTIGAIARLATEPPERQYMYDELPQQQIRAIGEAAEALGERALQAQAAGNTDLADELERQMVEKTNELKVVRKRTSFWK